MKNITVTYTTDPNLAAAAATSWQKPRRGFRFGLALVVGGVFGVGLVLMERMFGFTLNGGHIMAFGLGAVAVLCLWQMSHMRLTKHLKSITQTDVTRSGPTTAVFGPMDIHFESLLGESTTKWTAVDAIDHIAKATILRIGTVAIPIPDAALDAQMTPAVFRDRLTKWREAAS